MIRLMPMLLALIVFSAMTGCAITKSIITENETMLAAAGFQIKPADTPEKLANLRSFLPNKLVTETKNGGLYFLYADPKVCLCIYIGNELAYQKYQGMVYEKNLAETQRMTAEANERALMNWELWGWNPGWGPGWRY